MLLATFILSSLGLALASPVAEQSYSCRPGQKCWPSTQQWQQLNQTINGHLYETIPIGAPCYKNSDYYDASACSIVQNNYNSSIPRGNTFSETYWANWEACGASGCSLSSPNPTINLYPTCSLGSLATYYVDVREPSHISSALAFATKHNIRISIKNTGHDFFGRSMVPNSLAIWTHNLQTLAVRPNFTAHNCPSASGQVVGEMGAGTVAGDAYRYFGTHGYDVTGGYEESVGIAGGFGQAGGVGDFTTKYGLMVDNAVEFEVVTADGVARTINECNDADLFWAMRGGGGGTFAVLTKFRVKLYPSLPIHTYNFVAVFTGSNGSQQASLRTVMTAHASHQLAWSAELITGQGDYAPFGVSMDLVLPYADDGSKLRSATATFAAFVSNLTDVKVRQNNYTSYENYTGYLSFSAPDAKKTEPAGIFSQLASRLMPRKLFTSAEGIERLVDAVVYGMEKVPRLGLPTIACQVVFETPLSNPDTGGATSAHPAWRDAIWHVIHVGEWLAPLAPERAEEVASTYLQILDPLKELTPGGGAYFNEAHWGERKWEETFWGSNYRRLVEVKGKWDPGHIFDCWKCVGWRGKSDPFYSCYQEW